MLPCINYLRDHAWLPLLFLHGLYVLRKAFLFSSTSILTPPNYFPVSELKNHLWILCIVKAHGLKLYIPCNALAKKFAHVLGEHLIFMNIHPRKEHSHS
jgi:hypothetical protein